MGEGRFLANQLEMFDRAMAGRMSAADRDILSRSKQDLEAEGILQRVLRPGDPAPEFTLPDQNGASVRLTDRLALGPVVLLFVRGGWCPFCTLTLRAWQDALPRLHDAGGDVLAILPQAHERCCQTAERDLLAYPVLSDRGSAVADAYQVAFDLPQRARPLYVRLGHDLPHMNGDGSWRLSLPATFIIGQDRRIALAHTDLSPQRRLEPDEAIAAVRRLVS